MNTNYFVAKAVTLTTKNADKNGLLPILLDVKAGKCPSKRTISGTLAQREQIWEGGVYMFSSEEGESSEQYGRQFTFSNLGELKGIELIKTIKELGQPVVFNANDAEPVEGEAFTTIAEPATEQVAA